MDELKTYAIIRTGGKQYRVVPGQKIKVEKIEAEAGADITFSDVLFLKNGEVVDRSVGAVPKMQLAQKLDGQMA